MSPRSDARLSGVCKVLRQWLAPQPRRAPGGRGLRGASLRSHAMAPAPGRRLTRPRSGSKAQAAAVGWELEGGWRSGVPESATAAKASVLPRPCLMLREFGQKQSGRVGQRINRSVCTTGSRPRQTIVKSTSFLRSDPSYAPTAGVRRHRGGIRIGRPVEEFVPKTECYPIISRTMEINDENA